MNATERHPLAVVLAEAADGRFPAADGLIDVLDPDPHGVRAVVAGLGSDPDARRFTLMLVVACIPGFVAGAFLAVPTTAVVIRVVGVLRAEADGGPDPSPPLAEPEPLQ